MTSFIVSNHSTLDFQRLVLKECRVYFLVYDCCCFLWRCINLITRVITRVFKEVWNGKSYNKGIVVKEMYFPCIPEGAHLLFVTMITITIMMITTTDPMMRLSFIFCHHILRLTLRDVTRNSSARLESISDLPSRLSNLCPLSRILLMFSVIILETSATCCCNFWIFSCDCWGGAVLVVIVPEEAPDVGPDSISTKLSDGMMRGNSVKGLISFQESDNQWYQGD